MANEKYSIQFTTSYTANLNPTEQWVSYIHQGDFNGDGLTDFVRAGWTYLSADNKSLNSPLKFFVFLQEADGSFSEKTSTLVDNNTISGTCEIGVADFNRDGISDIALLGFTDFPVISVPGQVLLSNSSTKFTRINVPATAVHGLAIGDWNNDAYPDIFASGYHPVDPFLLFTPPASFHWVPIFGSNLGGSASAIGDVNNDGRNDLALIGPWLGPDKPDNDIYIYLQNQEGGVSQSPDIILKPQLGNQSHEVRGKFLDLNSDGNQELVIYEQRYVGLSGATTFQNHISIWKNQGNSSFVPVTNEWLPEQDLNANPDYSWNWMDLDGNGTVDLATGARQWGERSQNNAIYLNDGSGRLHLAMRDEFNGIAKQISGLLSRQNGLYILPSSVGDFTAYLDKNGKVDFFWSDTIFGTNTDVSAHVDANIDFSRSFVRNVSVLGSELDDTLHAWAGNDTLNGHSGNDSMFGGAGRDTFIGGAGNDALNGGSDIDTAKFSGVDPLAYSIQYNVADRGYIVADQSSGFNEGIDTLSDVEKVNFGDSFVFNLVGGTAGKDTLYGLSGNNIIFGDSGNDTLNGSAGVDKMWGGLGNDTLNGNGGNDTLFGDEGTDYLNGGADNDSMCGGEGNDALNGGNGIDTAYYSGTDPLAYFIRYNAASKTYTITDNTSSYSEGVDTLSGVERVNFGNNFIINLIGGTSGNDTLNALAGKNAMFGDAGNDTLNGGSDADAMFGGAGNDALNGNSGNDALNGLEGNDTLNGGDGGDWMFGGVGNDVYVVDNLSDYTLENSNEGIDTIQTSIELSGDLADNVENLTIIGTASLNGRGNSLANVITGNSSTNTLNGGEGNDTLNGLDGNDTLVGGGGNDALNGGNGIDTAYYNGTDPLAYFVNYNSSKRTFSVTDKASGYYEGADTLQNVERINFGDATVANLIGGSSGADTISGLGGNNMMFGAEGNDTLNGGIATDIMLGGVGNDTLNGGAGSDALNGEDGADTLNGGDDGDWMFGGAGNDILRGDAGSDFLIGGLGTDTLIGGAGKDAFAFGANFDSTRNYIADIQNDLVGDFNASEDVICFGGPNNIFDVNASLNGNQPFTYIGSNQFSAAGQLRYANGTLYGNVDNNYSSAEFQIRINLVGDTQLSGSNFYTATDTSNFNPWA